MTAVGNLNYEGKVEFAIDPASTEFFDSSTGLYDLGFKERPGKHLKLTRQEISDIYKDLLKKYPIQLLEDPFAEDDWESWNTFNKTVDVELVGDDLLATNVERMKIANDKGACNSLLLKINQIGSISEAIEA